MNPSYCVFTPVTSSYLAMALTMARSVVKNDCDTVVKIILLDCSSNNIASRKITSDDRISVESYDKYDKKLFERLRAYMNPFELSCAAKAICMNALINSREFEKIVFFDADIYCVSSLRKIWDSLDSSALLVSPHTVSPYPDDQYEPDDSSAIMHGYINGGFFAVNTTDSNSCVAIRWLHETVIRRLFYIPEIGLYGEQTWISALPWYFPNTVSVLKWSSINIAYWNMYERDLTYDEAFFSKNEKVIFFHMSGYDLSSPRALTKHKYRPVQEASQEAVCKLVSEYNSQFREVMQDFNDIPADCPCNDYPLYKRIRIYKKIHGSKPSFMQKSSGLSSLILKVIIIYDALQKFKAKVI